MTFDCVSHDEVVLFFCNTAYNCLYESRNVIIHKPKNTTVTKYSLCKRPIKCLYDLGSQHLSNDNRSWYLFKPFGNYIMVIYMELEAVRKPTIGLRGEEIYLVYYTFSAHSCVTIY